MYYLTYPQILNNAIIFIYVYIYIIFEYIKQCLLPHRCEARDAW